MAFPKIIDGCKKQKSMDCQESINGASQMHHRSTERVLAQDSENDYSPQKYSRNKTSQTKPTTSPATKDDKKYNALRSLQMTNISIGSLKVGFKRFITYFGEIGT